ncbi:MAG: BrnA antitoxin family protein [Acetobacteraceae bacterium]
MAKRSVSSARGGQAGGNAGRTRRPIDYSDIPDSTPEQLRAMRRVGRPPLGAEARQLIAIRLDREVLAALRREARRQKIGYQSLIHDVLARHVQHVA